VLGELTSPEISKVISETSILCLPMGSIEQHGPHLPLNTDVVLAEELTRRIVSRWGESLDLWQLPTLAVGLAHEHDWAVGTISLSIQAMTAFMRDMGREIARALPTRNLAVINGHGGNRGILEALAHELRTDFGLNVCILHPAALIGADANAKVPEIHGGKDETSMMLALAPHLVRQDLIAQLKNPPAGEIVRRTILDHAVTWPWSSNDKRIADFGVIGDPHAASAEFGKYIIERIVESACGALRQLLDNQRFLRR
jgi:creatinine amidohydrolase/Fe(II)-dependent formamide hydrolase-like protein